MPRKRDPLKLIPGDPPSREWWDAFVVRSQRPIAGVPPRYIILPPGGLTVRVSGRPARRGRNIPLHVTRVTSYGDPMEQLLLDSVVEPVVKERQGTLGKQIKYCLAPVDPWLLALAAIAWEGVVQGLAWDTVKHAMAAALAAMRDAGVAPEPAHRSGINSKVAVGFSWTEFSTPGKQKEIFLGLKASYRRVHEALPDRVAEPAPDATPTRRGAARSKRRRRKKA